MIRAWRPSRSRVWTRWVGAVDACGPVGAVVLDELVASGDQERLNRQTGPEGVDDALVGAEVAGVPRVDVVGRHRVGFVVGQLPGRVGEPGFAGAEVKVAVE
jgi:hypothetical protein